MKSTNQNGSRNHDYRMRLYTLEEIKATVDVNPWNITRFDIKWMISRIEELERELKALKGE